MPDPLLLLFDVFRVDLTDERLWRDDNPVRLTPKAFAALRCLIERPGQRVSKEELFEEVWPDTVVSEAVLTSCIRELRRALGDQARAPAFIETVHRWGYRFIAEVTPGNPAAGASTAAIGQKPSIDKGSSALVAREKELSQLHQHLARMLQGERQVVFVTGEAGIGKTTLADVFVEQVADSVLIARGLCVEHYGPGEPYLPLLEMLGHLGKGPDGARIVSLLHQHAPSWLLQLPSLVQDPEIDALKRRAGGTTQERMLRELTEAIEALAVEHALVLVLEDLHWSDVSTLDWLVYMARRRTTAQLLLVGTYRPADAMVHAHPIHAVTQNLVLQEYVTEIPLDYLPESGVAAYLEARFGAQSVPDELPQVLHQRTNGNPLFLAAVVNELVSQGTLRKRPGHWELIGGVKKVAEGVPNSLRQLIQHQLGQLTLAEQHTLEAASVAGKVFAVPAVAAAVDCTLEEVEECCAALAGRRQYLRDEGEMTWPDGTISTCLTFIHDLYREIAYERIPPNRRIRWHGQIGMRLEAAYGEHATTIAVELAEHFVQAREEQRAMPYLLDAARQALQRSAYEETMIHLDQGFTLLQRLPETSERNEHELQLQMVLGPLLMVTKGYGEPEVATVYGRARELCQQTGEAPQMFPVLWGLWQCANAGADHHTARELGEQMLMMARQSEAPAQWLIAHHVLWMTMFNQGEFIEAYEHIQHLLRLYDPEQHSHLAVDYGVADPGVCALGASVLWLLGYGDQAVQSVERALTLAQRLEHPFSIAYALIDAAFLHQRRRDVQRAQAQAEAAQALGEAQGFPYIVAQSMLLRGWALVSQQHPDGLPLVRKGFHALQASGMKRLYAWYVMALAYVEAGDLASGLSTVAEALTMVADFRECAFEAELYRLQGELVLRHDVRQPEQASISFQQALDVSRQQQARVFELRAAISLSRLWRRQGQLDKARELLWPIYNWFTEGFDTTDLQEAKALLMA